MSWRVVLLAAIGMTLLAVAALWPVSVISLNLPRQDNRQVYAQRACVGDQIRLVYRHSVERTLVEGIFEVGPEAQIVAVKTRMQSSGTGLPNTAVDRTEIHNGWINVDEGHKPIGPIRFFFVPINRPRLEISGRPIELMGYETGTLLEVAVTKQPRWQLLYQSLVGE